MSLIWGLINGYQIILYIQILSSFRQSLVNTFSIEVLYPDMIYECVIHVDNTLYLYVIHDDGIY